MHVVKGVTLAACATALAACTTMGGGYGPSFFVTSVNPGHGASLGGLAGADAHCQALATAAGYGSKTWHAYLSTQAAGGTPAVNARDRIGSGPWTNVKGVVIANNVAELHGTNNLNKQTGLTEKGGIVNGRGDTPNQHDILTGSKPDGTAFPPGDDKTCRNWTSGTTGSAIVGHLDRMGTSPPPTDVSWNSSHGTPGCDIPSLNKTGGQGYLYCFAVK